jgi:predicted nucleic acid-binding protein
VNVAYLDTSAVVKLYASEAGSGWLRSLLASSDPPAVLISHLTLVEATCAFARRRREGGLTATDHARVLAAFDHDAAYRYFVLDVLAEVVQTAKEMANRQPLRALDAIHLATAWLANSQLVQAGLSPVTFVCADSILLAIAEAEGLVVENPNSHL